MVNHDRGIFKLLLTIDGVADRIAFLIALKAPPLSHFKPGIQVLKLLQFVNRILPVVQLVSVAQLVESLHERQPFLLGNIPLQR